MFTYSVEQYVMVVYNCKSGELSKEQALADINKKYKSTQKYIKRKMTDIMKKHRFYRFVSGGIDELINIYDKAMDEAFEADRETYINICTKIVNKYLSEEKSGKSQKTDFDLARIAINEERSKVAKLCREERMITEEYEKAVIDIANIQNTSDKRQEPELVPNEKMSPRIKEMLASKVITGEKTNGRWVVNNEKHGIKELMEWADNNNAVFSTSYIIQTFCKQDGTPFTRGSINTYRTKNGLTGSDE
jgi:hypothetical protein